MDNLPASQQSEWKPSLREQQDRVDHRAWIAGRVVTVLSHYWRDDDDEALTGAIAADWADVLEGLPAEYIQKACIRYQQEEPRRKPTPGAIYQLARSMMPALRVVSRQDVDPAPERKRIDAATAQEICEQAGYAPKRFGGEND